MFFLPGGISPVTCEVVNQKLAPMKYEARSVTHEGGILPALETKQYHKQRLGEPQFRRYRILSVPIISPAGCLTRQTTRRAISRQSEADQDNEEHKLDNSQDSIQSTTNGWRKVL
jgi:hypothetical protein